MLKLLAMYQAMPPLVVGPILFAIGLAVGSFSTVLLHRVPSHRSIVAPSSHCPDCGHALSVRELIPILSFIWQRGKCRWCGNAIPAHYLLLELGAGAAVGTAGYMWGWAAGISTAAAWVAAVTATSILRGRTGEESPHQQNQSGFSLVEVLVSLLLISMAMAPVLDTIAVARDSGLAGQRRSLALGLARARVSELAQLGWTDLTQVDSLTCPEDASDFSACTVTGSAVSGDANHAAYQVTAIRKTSPGPNTRKVAVKITCQTCKAQFGLAVAPVTLEAVIRDKE